jgi:hypothetical protein
MIHYHGTRIACSDDQAARILKGRHAFVSYADTSQLSIVEEVCQSYALDNGAYSFFNSGKPVDWDGYYRFLDDVYGPSTDFAIIPDVIGGSEKEQDDLMQQWPFAGKKINGVPVWHSDESIMRLEMLADKFPLVCLGSGPGLRPDTPEWWNRMNQVFDVLTDKEGKPKVRIHLLKGLKPHIFSRLPLTSADSTMVGRHTDDNDTNWSGRYKPLSIFSRAMVLIDRIETFNSPKRWKRAPIQMELI